ncbi:MAG: His-Xaa-Ser repeat protein HxsA3, partial [bacterium]|nr:His-Xaa-Ser repeat protein HxsA3 [bacterium]
MDKELFPMIKRNIEDFITEEEGNISRSKVLAIGSVVVVLSVLLYGDDAYAAHRSHSSHRSH